VLPAASCTRAPRTAGILVNDVHSQLNETRVHEIVQPDSIEALQALVRGAARSGRPLSLAGGRHAMGGQQFGAGTTLVDMSLLSRVIGLDREAGVLEAGAGIQWPELVDSLHTMQDPAGRVWSIVQKQTGGDRISLGGSLAANAHGRGLTLKPIVGEVESFLLVDAAGEIIHCSRTENAELFRHAIGGYGLCGIIATVRLRLAPRRKVRRVVEVMEIDDVHAAFDRRIRDGYIYGDFQYSPDLASDAGLRRGVFSCYQPVDDDTPMPAGQKELSEDDWRHLIYLAHVDRAAAFAAYAKHYLATSGQVYWSDTHQMSTYVKDYHQALAGRRGMDAAGTEMITEIYVPRAELAGFMAVVREDLIRQRADLIYGTIRLIEQDDETALPWARRSWGCVIFNLHVPHDAAGRAAAERQFTGLIERGLERGGSYFLTYHRWADRRQVLAAHPGMIDFLKHKRRFDPEERFQSDWYRHYREMFAGDI